MAIYNRLGRTLAFNPGFGMQTTNVDGGTETIFRTSLGAPVQKTGAVAPADLDAGSTLVLFKTKTSNRISNLRVFNAGLGGLTIANSELSFFFAFLKDGKIVYPKYSTVGEKDDPCLDSLATGVDTDNTTIRGIKTVSDTGVRTYTDIWHNLRPNANNGAGGTVAYRGRIAGQNDFFLPQLEPNIGSIMDKALRAADGEHGADAVNPDGLRDMSAIDTDVFICVNLKGNVNQVQAEGIFVEIGIIETDISARNETEEYVKSWNQIPANGVLTGTTNGYDLNYTP